jgi:DNA-binding transcriptional MerR regulator
MTGSTIGQVADRTGFPTSTLRYYDRVGLVSPAGRTPAGYRVYDAPAISRLRFIARAKQLGCTLEEIQDLVSIWDAEQCRPVQRRFHRLVSDKIGETHERIAELENFVLQLRTAAGQLEGEPVDGPCAEGCACTTGAPAAPGHAGEHVPPSSISCSLAATEVTARVSDWDATLGSVRSRSSLDDGGLRLGLEPGVDLGRLGRLIADEQTCCPFLSFALTVDQRGIALEIRAPEDGRDVLTALFGLPDLPPAS